MCRSDPTAYIASHEEFDEFAARMIPGESTENMVLDFENFKYSDPILALDESTGERLLQWAIEEGIAQGCLAGSPFVSGDRLRKGGTIPSVRASAIGEPGDKARIVTVAEDWLTEFLQPFAHEILGELRTHPSVTAGLSRAWQGFEWVKGLRNAESPPDRHFLSSDLTTATDFCTHEYSQAMLEGFLEGLGRRSSYFDTATQLLCSSRVYEDPLGRDEFVTCRGILMGDPGAKAVLILHNLCSELESIMRYHLKMDDAPDSDLLDRIRDSPGPPLVKWRHFACSGDDHTAQGPKKYLQRITLNHSLNGMRVSHPQNFLSSIGAFYCEELFLTVGLRDEQIWGGDSPLKDRPYLEHPHVDSMKVRLFSPCSKEHEGKDESNPAIGKARQVHGMLAWLGGGWERAIPLFSRRWEQRLEAFLPKDLIFRYLPVKLGGIEAPAFHVSETEMRKVIREIPPLHLTAIKKILDGSSKPIISRVVATFATNARARGVNQDLIQDQIVEVLHNAELTGGHDDAGLQLAAGIPDIEWRDMHHSRKLEVARRLKLISVNDAINQLDRPYLFRDILYPEISRKHGIDPYRSAAYENKPWPLRISMFYDNLSKNSDPEDFTEVGVAQRESIASRILQWARLNKSLDIPREVYFVPERVVITEDLCTLRTPLGLSLP